MYSIFPPSMRPGSKGRPPWGPAAWILSVLMVAGPASAEVPERSISLPGVEARAQQDTILPGDTIPLAPVEVTVLRTVTPVSAAPMAVAVLEEEELRRARSGTFLEEALRGLPGVQVQNRFNPAVGERVAIRGFGARAQFGVRGVRILVDGIPATLPDGQSTLEHIDLGSIGRVEAVRGPASALFGNASGGVLAFHTTPPSTSGIRVESEVIGGSHGHFKGQSTASGTVGETGYLVSLSRLTWDGFRERPNEENATYGSADRSGLNARLIRPVGPGELSVTLNLMDLDAENPGSLPADMRDDPRRPAWNFNIVQGTSKQVRQGQAGARWVTRGPGLEWDLSAFGVRREVTNPIPTAIIDLDRQGGGIRLQVGRQESLEQGSLQWYAGVEGEIQRDDRLNFTNQQGSPGEVTLDQAERVRSLGVFAQATAPLPGDGQLMLGLRHDRHDFQARDHFPRDPAEVDATGDRAMNALSPSVGVHLPLFGQVNLFASVGTFFETPSTTELANRPEGEGGFNPELQPQEGTSGEVGLRGIWNGWGSWEVSTYRTHLRNELVPFEVPDAPGRTFFRNAGTSRHQGAEATISMRWPDRPVRAHVSYTWTDARFRAFELDGEPLDGNRIPGLAPHRARSTILLDPGKVFGEISAAYSHRVPVNDRNTEAAPSHTLLELRAGVREIQAGGLSLSPWMAITNLLDRDYVASVVVNAFGGRFYEPGPGRSFQLGVRTSF